MTHVYLNWVSKERGLRLVNLRAETRTDPEVVFRCGFTFIFGCRLDRQSL